ncbi:hypothetical protein GCM10011376_20830 [Nocardioides flavus (ex Wang et al. 2016)]|uniref:Uncharacterized protein n=1 Tax=Nocardioides flavus (ex Wang et al. 2016) TaxID=2058780 RepID=A0ABQ3HII2_9ACTN|nr:hypothetical protein [Nocardioides flavus (ex Wang et al. 2016)]GHE17473.1 hypothetical protein GCM10011376_20830 [Nocardioides flavus (ex Wang et al. 2016)]
MTPPTDSVRRLCAALDSVLAAAGFLPGQGGAADDGSGQVIYCIGHDKLRGRHPHLPQAASDDVLGTCDDLVLDIGAGGTLDRLDLETVSLEETLRQVGLDADADAVSRVVGRPVVDGLPVLEDAVRRLFGVAA